MMDVRWRCAFVISMVAVVGLTAGACGSTTTTAGAGSTTTAAPSDANPSGTAAPTTSTPSGYSSGGGTTVAAPGPVEIVRISTPYGDALGTEDGLVLYAWDEEADGTIACLDAECLEKWPPLLGTEAATSSGIDAARLTLVARPDGTQQVALDGKPLYHMAVDEPGEATCQGVEGWWILNPDGSKNANEVERA
jgi:predicted lipoprotein with Yx(FWY)xxD motif